MWNCSLHLWNSTLRCRRCLFVNPHPPPPPLVSTEELTSSSSLSPPASASLHPAYLRSGHTLLHPSLLQPGVRAAPGRITEGHGSPTCLDTAAKEGAVRICSVGLLFSGREAERRHQKKERAFCASSCLLSSSFSPVGALLSFICRAHPAHHSWRQRGLCLSGEVKRQKQTEALWLFCAQQTGSASMSRRRAQARRGGSRLAASPVFVMGVVVLFVILCVYLEMMLMFFW